MPPRHVDGQDRAGGAVEARLAPYACHVKPLPARVRKMAEVRVLAVDVIVAIVKHRDTLVSTSCNDHGRRELSTQFEPAALPGSERGFTALEQPTAPTISLRQECPSPSKTSDLSRVLINIAARCTFAFPQTG